MNSEQDSSSPFLQIQWNALPLATRQRLVDAQRDPSRAGCFWLGELQDESRWRHAIPDPTVKTNRALVVSGVVSLLLLLVLPALDFGNPYSGWLWQGGICLALYVATMGIWIWGFTHLARKTWERPRRGYLDGALLCPTELVEFRGTCIRAYPLAQFKGFRFDDVFREEREFVGSDGRMRYYRVRKIYDFTNLRMTFLAGELCFKVGGALKPYLLQNEQRLQAMAGVPPAQGAQAFRDLDPLFEARNDPAWQAMVASGDAPRIPPQQDGGPSCSLPRPTPRVLRPPLYAIAVIALLLGPGAWFVRNYLSDDVGYHSARSNGVDSLQAYVNNGWLYLAEAREALRAAREAQLFVDARTAAEPAGALRDFLRNNPHHPKVSEARALLHGHFEAASTAFAAQSVTDDPAVQPFMRRVLAFQERNGSPPVVMRFVPPDASVVRAFDTETRSIATLRRDNFAALTPRFAEAEMRQREQFTLQGAQTGFRAVFPDGIFHLEDGARAAPTSTSVRFDVAYSVSHTGAYMAGFGDGASVPGVVFDFRVVVSVPDGGPDFTYVTSVRPAAGALERWGASNGHADQVAAAASNRAFTLSGARLRGAFFRSGTQAFGTTADDSPTAATAPPLSGRMTATVTSASSTESATARLTLERGGRGVVGSYRSAHGGPRMTPGTVDGVQTGRVLTATCSDDDGASGPCEFTFLEFGRRFTGMMTLNDVRFYWAGETR